MSTNSRIEWTGSTWNPVTGCTKVSAGCDHCYAERMAKRLKAMGVHKYRNEFEVTIHQDVLNEPFGWKNPKMIFVNSMADLFHKDIPFEFLQNIFKVMEKCPQHIFQPLTKRSKQLARLQHKLPWPKNVWMGVTIESSVYNFRANDLRKCNAQTKFVSLEPLIGSLTGIDLSGIDWAVVGGESGPGARPIDKKWVSDIKRECRRQKTAFFFKQWGGTNKKKAGREFHGRHWDEMPLSFNHHTSQYPL